MKTELTEAKIQKHLNRFFANGSVRYLLDNLYVFNWESDKLMEMRSGLIYEYEIKISRADFKNDFKHKPLKHLNLCKIFGDIFLEEKYYQQLYEKDRKTYPTITLEKIKEKYNNKYYMGKVPNYFYYAVPQGMIGVNEVPSYAGLIYVTEDGRMIAEKKAPLLHNERYKDEELNLSEKFYYNMVKAKDNAEYWKKEYDITLKRLQSEVNAQGHELSYDELQQKLELTKESASYYKKLYNENVENVNYERMERRMLISEIRKYNPSFDYPTFVDSVTEKYNERYPNKKIKKD